MAEINRDNLTEAELLALDLRLIALVYSFACNDARRGGKGAEARCVSLVAKAQRRLDRESGLNESGKLAIWLGIVRDVKAGRPLVLHWQGGQR